MAVFECERAGVKRQRVELQRAGDAVGLDGLAASRRTFFGLRVEVRTFVVHLLLRRLQQLSDKKNQKKNRRQRASGKLGNLDL